MRIANRRFKPTLAGTLTTCLLLPILIGLGFWQLSRAEEKRALLAEFQLGSATTQQLSSNSIERMPSLQQAIATGHYDASRQILLDNIPYTGTANSGLRNGQPGYHVLTPFKLADERIVLVNRGWLPLGSQRNQLPAINVNEQPRSIRGRVKELPRPGIRMGVAAQTNNWPRVLNFPTLTDLRAAYGDKLLPKILLLDPSEPDGFARDWSARYSFGEFGPDRHLAYAVQWFALAVTLCVIYGIVNFKRIETLGPAS